MCIYNDRPLCASEVYISMPIAAWSRGLEYLSLKPKPSARYCGKAKRVRRGVLLVISGTVDGECSFSLEFFVCSRVPKEYIFFLMLNTIKFCSLAAKRKTIKVQMVLVIVCMTIKDNRDNSQQSQQRCPGIEE